MWILQFVLSYFFIDFQPVTLTSYLMCLLKKYTQMVEKDHHEISDSWMNAVKATDNYTQ